MAKRKRSKTPGPRKVVKLRRPEVHARVCQVMASLAGLPRTEVQADSQLIDDLRFVIPGSSQTLAHALNREFSDIGLRLTGRHFEDPRVKTVRDATHLILTAFPPGIDPEPEDPEGI